MKWMATLIVVGSMTIAAPAQAEPLTFTAQPGDEVIAAFESDPGNSVIEARVRQTLTSSGSDRGRGALRFHDTVSDRVAELGWYRWGAGWFSPFMFEFFTPIVSIRNFEGSRPGRLDVRDAADKYSGTWFLGDGQIGSEATGALRFILGPPDDAAAQKMVGKFTDVGSSRQTSLLLLINDDGTTEVRRVRVGPINSGGLGYRALRVVN